jgi:rhomboid family protein
MFPFRDHNPSRRRPYVTWALIAINIVVFAFNYPLMGNNAALASFWDKWAMVPAEITYGVEYYTAFTSLFLHAGIMHIAGNMLFLWVFGDNVEDAMGHIPFLAFYLASGLGADAFYILSDPYSGIPIVGASGAIAGVLGAYMLLYPKAKVDVIVIFIIFFKIFKFPAWIVLGVWMAIQTFSGFAYSADQGGVAYWAHIGGFIVGMVLAVPLWLRLGGQEFWRRSRFHPPHAPTFETRTTTIPIVRRRP